LTEKFVLGIAFFCDVHSKKLSAGTGIVSPQENGATSELSRYPYMLMPDHVPVAKNDPDGLQSFAFCYGYIRGLIQSLG
jgi:hypothetical protein